jgi:hypothetical protein
MLWCNVGGVFTVVCLLFDHLTSDYKVWAVVHSRLIWISDPFVDFQVGASAKAYYAYLQSIVMIRWVKLPTLVSTIVIPCVDWLLYWVGIEKVLTFWHTKKKNLGTRQLRPFRTPLTSPPPKERKKAYLSRVVDGWHVTPPNVTFSQSSTPTLIDHAKSCSFSTATMHTR